MFHQNKQVAIKQLGRKSYQEAWDIQETLFNEIVSIKLENRKLDAPCKKLTPNYLLFCEHPHVYTLGKSGNTAHLLTSEATLQAQGIAFHVTNRGGDITYHGPGQGRLIRHTTRPASSFAKFSAAYSPLIRDGASEMLAIRLCSLY